MNRWEYSEVQSGNSKTNNVRARRARFRAQENFSDKNCVKLISLLMQSAQIKMLKGINITLAIGAWGKQSIKESITATATNSAE